ncbi:MAG: helix-turn-helix transcriptional regulator [Lachnospiraceae bacterium]|nr:helix-turn-helix transcriptional regulator [Lachnospiraceae bacterium]
MEMHAYSFDYLESAQKNLGDMLDFAVNTCRLDLESFYQMFLSSCVAGQFGKGNPRYVAGMTGAELAWEVLESANYPHPDQEAVFYLDKSPEYWCGWSLTYYQWVTGKSFQRIERFIPVEEVLCMYPTHHEADVERFRETMDGLFHKRHTESYLKWRREQIGLSVEELSEESGIDAKRIRAMENDFSKINIAASEDVRRLAVVLKCSMEDLLEF